MVNAKILSVVHEGVEYRCKEVVGHSGFYRSQWLSEKGEMIEDSIASKALAAEAVRMAEVIRKNEREALLAELYPPPSGPAPTLLVAATLLLVFALATGVLVAALFALMP